MFYTVWGIFIQSLILPSVDISKLCVRVVVCLFVCLFVCLPVCACLRVSVDVILHVYI